MKINLNIGDTQLIIADAKSSNLLRNQLAYVLATAYHETAHTMKPVREYGGEKYLKSKKYYPYVGMGYVQLTWLENYKKASDYLGVNFVSNPKLLLEPKHASRILIQGMVEGWFTGKKLSNYITLQKSDFRNARRIVNSMDKADLIAGYAQTYDKLLLESGYGVDTIIEAKENDILPTPVTDEQPLKSKRSGLWLTTGFLPAIGLLDWRVQLFSVVAVAGIAVYSIVTMPAVKRKIESWL